MPTTPLTWDGTADGIPLTWDAVGITWDGSLPPNPEPNPNQKKAMPQLRVLLGFAAASDHALEETGQSVHDHLYVGPGLAAFPDPPVTAVQLGASLADFSESIAAATAGGPADTAMKENKREILIGQLRQLAGYVQSLHGNDLAKLLESGFAAVSTNSASSPLETPVIRRIDNVVSGQLIPSVTRVKNARVYEVRYFLLDANGTPGPVQNGGLHSSSRALPVTGLTPGALYQIQVRAIGGSTGYSEWSLAVTQRCM
jgi:hypothetical protein